MEKYKDCHSYYDLLCFFSGMGTKHIQTFYDEIMGRSIEMDNYLKENDSFSVDFCVDYSNEKIYGEHCVYAWVNGNGEVFYIGSGSVHRAQSTAKSNRGKKFFEQFNAGSARLFLICTRVEDGVAKQIEDAMIKYAVIKGCALVNVNQVPNKEELFFYRRIEEANKVPFTLEEYKAKVGTPRTKKREKEIYVEYNTMMNKIVENVLNCIPEKYQKSYDEIIETLKWLEGETIIDGKKNNPHCAFDSFLSMLRSETDKKLTDYPVFEKQNRDKSA